MLEVDEQKSPKPRPGTIRILDGKVLVTNPVNCDAKAMLIPGTGVVVTINGTILDKGTPLTAEDNISLEYACVKHPGSVSVLIAPDYLSASLKVKFDCLTYYYLEDTAPVPKLKIEAKSRSEQQCPLDFNQIMELLANNNINTGIDVVAISDFLKHPNEGNLVVARGVPPVAAVDDRVEVMIDLQPVLKTTVREDGKIDYREFKEIPSVKAGTVLAVKYAGSAGKPGTGVDGKILPAGVPKEIILAAGRNTQLVEQEEKIVGLTDGLPKLIKRGNVWTFDIEPQFNLTGDLDRKTGDVRFNGNIKISGSVQDEITVNASGDIEIGGTVVRASVFAGGQLRIRGNILGSRLVSGGFGAVFSRFSPLLNDIFISMESMHNVSNQLYNMLPQGQQIKYGLALAKIMEKKYMTVPAVLDKLVKMLAEEDNKINNFSFLEKCIRDLGHTLNLANLLEVTTPVEFEGILQHLNDSRVRLIEISKENSSGMELRSLSNSTVQCSGNLRITGYGCSNCIIRCDSELKIDGIFRGGEVFARKKIEINEAGSIHGVKTLIRGPEGCIIKVNKAYAGVNIRIGPHLISLDQLRHGLVYQLIDGTLVEK